MDARDYKELPDQIYNHTQASKKLHPLHFSAEQIILVMKEVRDFLLKRGVSQLSEEQKAKGSYLNYFLFTKRLTVRDLYSI